MANAFAVKWDALRYINGQGLDLGCGDARIHDWLVGVDIKPGTTSTGPNMIADARDLSIFADESQDFIFSSYLLNELDNWPEVLAEWWRLIREDGYLILFLPLGEGPKKVVDAMAHLRPWQLVEARANDEALFHVYRKCDRPTVLEKDERETCVVVKLGAHGDALWASSVFPGLKKQGYKVVLYTQDTGECVLRHDPNIDELVKFESRVPLGELGQLFDWLHHKYKEVRILIECVEGTLLPSPAKVNYYWPLEARHQMMNFNYLDMHHLVAGVPLFPKHQKFYPNQEEMEWANAERAKLNDRVVVIVPNGSGPNKYWPYTKQLVEMLVADEDTSVVVLGDRRNIELESHERLSWIGTDWDVRKAMTFVQLADVVAGQETGMLNAVAFNREVHKIVFLSHSSIFNLTRDWYNVNTIRMMPKCAGESGCHLLHYDWSKCTQDETTKSALCQAMISADLVYGYIRDYFKEQDKQVVNE